MPGVVGGVFYLLFLLGILGAILWFCTVEAPGNPPNVFDFIFAMKSPRTKQQQPQALGARDNPQPGARNKPWHVPAGSKPWTPSRAP